MLIFLIGSVAAASDDGVVSDNQDALAADSESVELSAGEGNGNDDEVQDASFSVDSKSNYLINDSFKVSLRDENGNGIANKSVYFNVNNNITEVSTNEKGVASFILNFPAGKYSINFIFNETGYSPIEGSKDVSVLTRYVTKFVGSKMDAYAGVKKTFKATLTANGSPLANREVTFTLDKKTYTRKTNSKGEASITVYLSKGNYKVTFSYKGENKIKASTGSSRIYVKLLKNPYKTKYRTVIIDADGGFTKAFLNDVASKLRKAGWNVLVRGIGPGQHSINYKKAKNCVYMPIYNGLCAGTIKEMAASYYGGVLKKNKAVLAPSWYTEEWVSEKMSKFRNDITKFGYLKRAWDDNFSPRGFKGLNDPAGFMTKNNIKYTVGDTTYKIVEQFLYGGWNAHH